MKPLFVLSSCFLLLIACNNGSGVTGTDSTSGNQGGPFIPGVNNSSGNLGTSYKFLVGRSTYSDDGRYYFATCEESSFEERGTYLEIEDYSNQRLTLIDEDGIGCEFTGGSKIYDEWIANDIDDSGIDLIVDISENSIQVYLGFKNNCPAEYFAEMLIDELVSEGFPRRGITINTTGCTNYSGTLTMDGVSVSINGTINFPTITARISGNGRSCQLTQEIRQMTESDCSSGDYSITADYFYSIKRTETCNGSFMKAAPGNQKKSIENIVIQALHKNLTIK